MSEIHKLHDLFVNELRDMYSAEQQLTEALPKMRDHAQTKDLKRAFSEHIDETRNHITRLDRVFQEINQKPEGVKCKAMAGLVSEGSEIMEETDKDKPIMDAALIAASQKVEHYEIASYGTLVTYAENLGLNNVAELLKQNLQEEKQADKILNELATDWINREAKS